MTSKFLRPLWRYIALIYLPDLLLIGAAKLLPYLPDWAATPLMSLAILSLPVLLFGGLMLIWAALGAVWGSLPGLRWHTLIIYIFATLISLPFPYLLNEDSSSLLFWIAFLNGQQTLGFAFGAWYRMLLVRSAAETTGTP